MSDIKVSIVTVCLNAEEEIEKTIRSVIDQNYDNYQCGGDNNIPFKCNCNCSQNQETPRKIYTQAFFYISRLQNIYLSN